MSNQPRATHDTAITEHAVVIPTGIVAICAEYSGPTNTRSSAVKVWRADESKRTAIRVTWDHALDSGGNFAAAVAEWIDRQVAQGNEGFRGRWVVGGGQDNYYAVKVGRLSSDVG